MKGASAEKKCYANTLRSYCVSTIESGSSVMEDCVDKIMTVSEKANNEEKKTIRERDVNNENKGEEDKLKLDLIRNMLVLDPKKRITVDGALQHVGAWK